MENLIFRTSNNKLVGVVWIVGGLGLLIIRITRKEIADPGDWTTPIVFCIMGIIFFTPLVGSDKAKIEISDQSLRIRWINWYRTVTVMEDEIESIILASNGVMIKRKDNKPLKIKFYLIDKKQKDQVYKFFTDYAHEKNFNKERQLNQI